MIFVIATIEVQPGRRDDLVTEFQRLVPLVQAEQGCLEYGPALDVETNIPAQGAVRENIVTVMEKWESIEDLEAHLIAPHMMDFRGKVKDITVDVKLQILQPA